MAQGSLTKQIRLSVLTPWQAFKVMIGNWPILRLSIIPLFLGTIAYLGTFYVLYHHVFQLIQKWIPQTDKWYSALLMYVAVLLATVVIIVIGALAYSAFGRLLMAPFSDLICARTERALKYSETPDLTFFQTLKDLPRLFRVEAVKLLFSLLVAGFLFLVSFAFPPLAVLSTIIGFWLLAFQFVDYPMERRRLPFSQRLQAGLRSMPALICFGALLTLAISIPILGVIALPVGVIGGTMLYHQVIHD